MHKPFVKFILLIVSLFLGFIFTYTSTFMLGSKTAYTKADQIISCGFPLHFIEIDKRHYDPPLPAEITCHHNPWEDPSKFSSLPFLINTGIYTVLIYVTLSKISILLIRRSKHNSPKLKNILIILSIIILVAVINSTSKLIYRVEFKPSITEEQLAVFNNKYKLALTSISYQNSQSGGTTRLNENETTQQVIDKLRQNRQYSHELRLTSALRIQDYIKHGCPEPEIEGFCESIFVENLQNELAQLQNTTTNLSSDISSITSYNPYFWTRWQISRDPLVSSSHISIIP